MRQRTHRVQVSAEMRASLLLPAIFILLAGATPLVANAAISRVPQQYATIQAAIDAAHNGDEIIVSPGTYTENLKINGKNVNLHSTDPTNWQVVDSTVIDGNGQNNVVTYAGTENESGRLAGFKICRGGYWQAGSSYDEMGSGIRGNGCKALIELNHITRNSLICLYTSGSFDPGYLWKGGGLYQCNGIIQNNLIERNRAHVGAGVYGCNGTIRNNLIIQNESTAVLSYFGSTPSGNPLLAEGYGGSMAECNGKIINNTISNCIVTVPALRGQSARIKGGGLIGCKGLLSGNIIWTTSPTLSVEFSNNSVPSYSCIKGWSGGGTKNLTTDPRFVDAAKGNWRLKPDSPCIDAAQTTTGLTTDFDAKPRGKTWIGQARGDGSHTDIGAFEFQPGPVTLWIPGPTDPKPDGTQVTVAWATQSTAGKTITLDLFQGSSQITSYGSFTFTGTHSTGDNPATAQVRLPWGVAGDGLIFRGFSAANKTLYGDTAAFAMFHRNGVKSSDWLQYY